ncbi:hypothetical protein MP228_012338 [Amoeboaphelidium protococcarum]|nr:hypothetical protein MP228_012338 [Amoeboaphelidium protococcarum]
MYIQSVMSQYQQYVVSKDQLKVCGAILFYIITSISMVIANKLMLNNLPDLPLTVLELQLIFAALMMLILHITRIINLGTSILDIGIIKKLYPLIAINVVGLSLNTLCLKYIDASVYQVARSLILPFTVLFEKFYLQKTASKNVLICCGIICLGFLLGTIQLDVAQARSEVSLVSSQFLGVLFGVLSSITTAAHAIIIKGAVEVVKGDTLKLVWYNNFLSSLALAPIIFVFTSEIDSYASIPSFNILVHGTIVTGIVGTLLNLSGFLQIKLTSPLTHMVSSALRGVLQTILAVMVFNDVITAGRMAGIIFVIAGSAAYAYLKVSGDPSDKQRKQYQHVEANGELDTNDVPLESQIRLHVDNFSSEQSNDQSKDLSSQSKQYSTREQQHQN